MTSRTGEERPGSTGRGTCWHARSAIVQTHVTFGAPSRQRWCLRSALRLGLDAAAQSAVEPPTAPCSERSGTPPAVRTKVRVEASAEG